LPRRPKALNSKFVEAFNRGDFAAVASLYTKDATVLPPGAAMVHCSAAIEALWKSFGEQVSNPKLTTIDFKELGPSAGREIGTYSLNTKGSPSKELSGKYVVVWEKGRERVEALDRHLERWQIARPHNPARNSITSSASSEGGTAAASGIVEATITWGGSSSS
jgi:ketosteroid isomerase-like protein